MSAQTKIALVTGGSRGLGKDMAVSIAAKGIDVIITYRTQKAEAAETVKLIEEAGQQGAALELDMSDFKSIPVFVQSMKGLLQSKWH